MEKSDNTTSNQTLSASLCTAGCGFFGNQKFDGMCSQCYKDALKRKQVTDSGMRCATPPSASASQSVETGTTTIKPISNISSTSTIAETSGTKTLLLEPAAGAKPCAEEEGAVAESAVKKLDAIDSESPASPTPSEPEKKSKKRNRCNTCKKKVGLTGFECRCGGLYCGLHRYSDKHDCQYDYKKEGEETIRKNNPLIVGSKVQKI